MDLCSFYLIPSGSKGKLRDVTDDGQKGRRSVSHRPQMGSEPLLFLCLPSVHVSASSSRRPDVDADQWINQYLLFPPVFTAKKQQRIHRFIPFICWKLQNKGVWDWTKHPVCAWTSQIPTFSVPASYFLSLEPSGYETRLKEGKQKRLRTASVLSKSHGF